MLFTAVSTTAVPAARHVPTGAAFDVVLLLHVACVVVSLGTVVVSGVQAARLLASGAPGVPPTLAAYFAPGVNWAGRTLYGVPVFGFALLAMSRGAYRLGDAWVLWGLGLWVAGALCAEGLLWPAERRIQARLAAGGPDPAVPGLRQACRTTVLTAGGLVVALVLATVLMVARP